MVTATQPRTETPDAPTTVADTGRRRTRRGGGSWWGLLAWLLGIVFFFPVLWMVLTSFKSESQAYTNTPSFVFSPTLSEYRSVFSSGVGTYFANSAMATIVSTL
ncbi:MAG: carbohydrate ABC transporter permease, partial [Acidimicrobiales bacterium]